MTIVERLRLLADALPASGAVTLTRRDLLELLAEAEAENESGSLRAATPPEVDLTVPQLADLFARGESTIRSWLSTGRFPGAYRLHDREWRVPRAAVTAMQEAERERARTAPTSEQQEVDDELAQVERRLTTPARARLVR